MNLMMLLEMAASGLGDRVAIQNADERLSYAELFAAAGAAGAELRAAGVARAALCDVNSLVVPIGLFGCACAGIPCVPLNYRLTARELESLAAEIAPAWLVTDAEHTAALAPLPEITLLTREAFLARARASAAPPEWPDDPDAIALLLFTSGTTGPPKAALLRHRHLVSYVLGSVEFGSAAEDDAALVSVPP